MFLYATAIYKDFPFLKKFKLVNTFHMTTAFIPDLIIQFLIFIVTQVYTGL